MSSAPVTKPGSRPIRIFFKIAWALWLIYVFAAVRFAMDSELAKVNVVDRTHHYARNSLSFASLTVECPGSQAGTKFDQVRWYFGSPPAEKTITIRHTTSGFIHAAPESLLETFMQPLFFGFGLTLATLLIIKPNLFTLKNKSGNSSADQ